MNDENWPLASAAAVKRPTLGSTLGLVALCVLAVTGVVVLVEYGNLPKILDELSAGRAHLHSLVATLGFWAPVIFIIAYAALMLLIWVPSWPCTVIGGFLFGTVEGTICSLIATTLGAVGVFELARAGLAQRLPRSHPLMRRLDAGFRRDALEYVIALRVMPVIPFGIIHVAAAAFGISLRVFTLGTVIGMLPCVLIYSFLGEDLDQVLANGGHLTVADFLSLRVMAPLFALAALALVPIAVRRFRERRPPT
jgi:uncharacterized membrane protein YdjX (TVP38/TMEM64 family)